MQTVAVCTDLSWTFPIPIPMGILSQASSQDEGCAFQIPMEPTVVCTLSLKTLCFSSICFSSGGQDLFYTWSFFNWVLPGSYIVK